LGQWQVYWATTEVNNRTDNSVTTYVDVDYVDAFGLFWLLSTFLATGEQKRLATQPSTKTSSFQMTTQAAFAYFRLGREQPKQT